MSGTLIKRSFTSTRKLSLDGAEEEAGGILFLDVGFLEDFGGCSCGNLLEQLIKRS